MQQNTILNIVKKTSYMIKEPYYILLYTITNKSQLKQIFTALTDFFMQVESTLLHSYTTLTTVPIGTVLANSMTSLLYILIHPFDTAFPIDDGLFVP